jgi:hypothetical protein
MALIGRHVTPVDVTGTWTADVAHCNFGTALHPTRLTLQVSRNGGRLEVIEVANGEDGTSLSVRQYEAENRSQAFGTEIGTARTIGRIRELRLADQLDEWRISGNGSKLNVSRWIGVPSAANQQILILRRSSRIAE